SSDLRLRKRRFRKLICEKAIIHFISIHYVCSFLDIELQQAIRDLPEPLRLAPSTMYQETTSLLLDDLELIKTKFVKPPYAIILDKSISRGKSVLAILVHGSFGTYALGYINIGKIKESIYLRSLRLEMEKSFASQESTTSCQRYSDTILPTSKKIKHSWSQPSLVARKKPECARKGARRYCRTPRSYLWHRGSDIPTDVTPKQVDWREFRERIEHITEGSTEILRTVVSHTQKDGQIKDRLDKHSADDVGRPSSTRDHRKRIRKLIAKANGGQTWAEFLTRRVKEWLQKDHTVTTIWHKLRVCVEILTGQSPSSMRRRVSSMLGKQAKSTPAERYRHDAMTQIEVKKFVDTMVGRGMTTLATWAAVTFETVARAGSIASIRLGGVRCFRDHMLLFCPSNKTRPDGIVVRVNEEGPVGAFLLLQQLLNKHEEVGLQKEAFLFGEIHPEKNKDPTKRLKQSFTLQSQRVVGIQTGSHALRRGAVIHLLCAGVRQEVIMALGGWSTVEGYMAYIDRGVREAMGIKMLTDVSLDNLPHHQLQLLVNSGCNSASSSQSSVSDLLPSRRSFPNNPLKGEHPTPECGLPLIIGMTIILTVIQFGGVE
ncbi:hypothetical protein ADUPG1_010846, partial [Aduncisulcus paluster]